MRMPESRGRFCSCNFYLLMKGQQAIRKLTRHRGVTPQHWTFACRIQQATLELL
jgi:hypothetical protein